ncbi:MAG: hypothetical protein Q6J68_04755 [Thermostichales cyanobacterium SZTDM-1c_bins_54]
MALSPAPTGYDLGWPSLREVIVRSSGFQTWLQSQAGGHLPQDDRELQQLVRLYLEQTLSTLAY